MENNYEKAYEVVYQIEEVVSKYYKGENQDIVDELTESIDKYESAAGEEYKEEIDDDESAVKDEKQPEEINPTDDYTEILEEYKKVAESNFSEELLEQSSYINDGVWNFRGQDIYSVYYRLADLSDDQSPELLISVNEKETPHSIVDVYGMQDGVPVRIIENNPSVGYRSIYYITEDKRIKNVGSGGALFTQISYYKIPSGSVTMELDEQYIYNGEQGDVYTHIGSDDVSTSITKENYMQVLSGEDVDYESEWEELYAGNAIHYIE